MTVDVEPVDVTVEIAAQFRVMASRNVAASRAATPVVDQPLHEDNDAPLPADFSLPSSDEAGFLNESHGAVFEADLYIAAMARSGSTLLANLLTLPSSIHPICHRCGWRAEPPLQPLVEQTLKCEHLVVRRMPGRPLFIMQRRRNRSASADAALRTR